MVVMTKIKCLALFAAASTLAFGMSAFGAVVIDSAFNGQYVPGTYVDDSTVTDAVTSYTIGVSDLTTAGFSAAGHDKLALAISTKWASNAGGAVTSLTYDGVSLSNAIARNSYRAQDEIWYLDSVTSDGDIAINFDGVTEGFAIYLWSLDGTKDGFQNSAQAPANDDITPALTSTVDGSFVMWEVSDNWGTISYSGAYDSADGQFGGRGGSTALWNIEGTAGTFQELHTGGRYDTGQVGVVFEAIPEPASALLLVAAFAGIGLLRRKFQS